MWSAAMLKSLSLLLQRISSGYTIAFAIAVYAIFISQVMPAESERSFLYAGEWGSPDGHFFYTPDELYAAISTWGDDGRQAYIEFRLGLDIIWALTYTAFLIAVTSCALRSALAPDDNRQLLNVFALIPMCCDLLENALGITLASNFPERMDNIAWIATGITSVKWSSLAVAHAIMLYALILAAIKRWGSRQN
jgi:hypothetical protein